MNYSISYERTALAKIGQKLITREAAGFRFTHYDEFHGTLIEPATHVFVHITETNPKSYSSDAAHARAVEAIGISRFPNTGVSYNRLVMQSGKVFEAQPMGRQGAHTVNNKNLTKCVSPGCPSKGGSIPSEATNANKYVRAYAICQNTNDVVTDAELDGLARAIAADQLAGLVKKGAPIHGHRCVAYKSCPGDKMWARMQELENRVALYLSRGLGSGNTGGGNTDTPPKQDDNEGVFDMAVSKEEFDASIDANDKKWTVSREHWDSQAWAYLAVAIATAMRILDGKPSPGKSEVDAAMSGAVGVLKPLENSFDPK